MVTYHSDQYSSSFDNLEQCMVRSCCGLQDNVQNASGVHRQGLTSMDRAILRDGTMAS